MDWTTATDDGLVERLTHCTLCGRTPVHLWGICGTARLALAYVLCRGCQERGGVRQVEALFTRRYEGGTLGAGASGHDVQTL